MKGFVAACVSLLGLVALPDAGFCAAPLQRYLLVAGANQGGLDRPQLQYAVSDAERFARVLVELGGVNPANEIVLREPKLREFLQALDQISARASEGRRAAAASGGGRVEVIVYYSGHADEKGLLLGDDRYSYRSLRDRLDQIPADVRIAVLDACASGAFTRPKGGKTRPPFLVDESSTMLGHAFLSSSSATEAAQESDRIGGSYFTHYLVSGLRGAADTSGDGKVTLNEAYQFAFDETLGRTEQTKGGPQHPSYDITLSGTGDVVMTDIRQTTATLVLDEQLGGRVFVRNAAKQLVAELYKPAGRRIELAVEPGAFEVRLERGSSWFVTTTRVPEEGRVVLDSALFRVTTPEPTQRRGGGPPPFAVAGRNRLALRLGMVSGAGASGDTPTVIAGDSAGTLLVGLQYTRFIREDLAFTLELNGFGMQSGAVVSPQGTFAGDSMLIGLPIGVRWNPMHGDLWKQSMKPYVLAGVGPVFGLSSGSTASLTRHVVAGDEMVTTFEARLGGGVDLHLGRSWAVGIDGGYSWINFSSPVGGRTSYSGFQLNAGLGWVFGHGYHPR